ncbi:MAG TPA: ankyrin repeat domain-containing protein [Spirochaetota bacterium]|nr:ankyrin repeat domain-containing protein [Spirochaetota bacterium]HOM37776.1 ankyrin repeat domain-containing protein [Spirochaetota bacterium]HPQ49347.1 ankyrin repeat domain-containing protein [Spirochaetota bacterium]
MSSNKSFKRKMLIVDKDFQTRFILKFIKIALVGGIISTFIILVFYYFTYKYKGKDLYRYLIEVGSDNRIDYNIRDKNGKTPIFYAKDSKIVNILIQKGADINIADNSGNTILHIAALEDRLDLARIYIENGIRINQTNKEGKKAIDLYIDKYKSSPLHWFAGIEDTEEMVRLIAEGKYDINVTDDKGRTPLHIAATYGRVDAIHLLLSQKASPSIKDNEGFTPMYSYINSYLSSPIAWYIILGDKDNLLKEIKANKDKINFQDKDGNTPLHLAISLMNTDFVKILIQNGADPAIVNNSGKSCLELAQETKNFNIIKILYTYYQSE